MTGWCNKTDSINAKSDKVPPNGTIVPDMDIPLIMLTVACSRTSISDVWSRVLSQRHTRAARCRLSSSPRRGSFRTCQVGQASTSSGMTASRTVDRLGRAFARQQRSLAVCRQAFLSNNLQGSCAESLDKVCMLCFLLAFRAFCWLSVLAAGFPCLLLASVLFDWLVRELLWVDSEL